jgi:hypothetical protein
MSTLVLRLGLGQVTLRPARGMELEVDCPIADQPQRRNDDGQVTLEAACQTRLGLSFPKRVSWHLGVPRSFDQVLVQIGGGKVEVNDLLLSRIRLEGAGCRLVCSTTTLGRLELIGTGLQAELAVDRIDHLVLEGLRQRVNVRHGDEFALDGHCAGPACRVEAADVIPSATHRVHYQLNGLGHLLEIGHGFRRIR